MRAPGVDFYEILDVAPSATQDEIKHAYRKKALELHPDRNGGSSQAEELFKKLTEAYAVLSNPARREEYDRSRAHKGPRFDSEQALKDLFSRPEFQQMFQSLAEEMAGGARNGGAGQGRQGGRYTPHGPVFFGGVFVFGPGTGVWSTLASLASFFLGNALGSQGRMRGSAAAATPDEVEGRGARRVTSGKQGLIGRLFGRKKLAAPVAKGDGAPQTLNMKMRVARELLRDGGPVMLRIPVPEGEGMITLKLNVKSGTKPGSKHRLPGKGPVVDGVASDLVLELLQGD